MSSLASREPDFGPGSRDVALRGQVRSPIQSVNLPANASAEMQKYFQNRTVLAQNLAKLRETNPSLNGQALTQEFDKQNAPLLKEQKELAQVVMQQQAQAPLPEPPPLQVPPDASPQLRTFLTERDQLVREQIATINQHRTDPPAVRQAAVTKWRQDNADRIQEIQQLSQSLAQASTASPAHE